MKNLIIGILSLTVIFAVISCSEDVNPKIRVQNERSDRIDVKIRTSENKSVDFTQIEGGKTTDYQSVSEGNIVAVAVTQNESISFLAEKSGYYTIVISSSKPLALNVDK